MEHYEKKIREFLDSSEVDQLYKSMLLNLFPEFRESEDERIKKELIGFLRNIPNSHYTCEEMAVWLEKQCEQFEKCMYSKDNYTDEDRLTLCAGCEEDCKLKQKPVEWSEDDNRMCNQVIELIEEVERKIQEKDGFRDSKDWLKSLRPQNHWKPSLSQLNALGVVTKGNAPDDIEEINSLYNDLKKLM